MIDAADAVRLEECLAGDGIAVIPTDTVYGLAGNPESATVVRRIYELKQRPPVKPAAVMFFALEPALESLTELGSHTRTAVQALLPGPVTLLLPNRARRFPLACGPGAGGSETLGLRVPALPPALAALSTVGAPVLQSSANLSGEPEARRLADVPAPIRAGADFVLDGGELPGIPSTVIDLREYERSGEWRIAREGPLTRAEVELILTSC